jgi:hypothetical protein
MTNTQQQQVFLNSPAVLLSIAISSVVISVVVVILYLSLP